MRKFAAAALGIVLGTAAFWGSTDSASTAEDLNALAAQAYIYAGTWAPPKVQAQ
ncbi:MAG TPA: hypothetical protein VMB20_03985 [Candidatus Acidoferrum sp.]|nr:hypothetical protein [Candidatus Acidoferrum sp.]